MNVFILTDLEGISGVSSIQYMDRTSAEYCEARKHLTNSINQTIAACHTAGAEMIYYLDGHGGGNNVTKEKIDKTAIQVTLAEWQELLRTGKIDCQVELGCHARAGTIGGFLDHTINSSQWFSYQINGREFGELGMHALLCGRYDVPVIACSGDETACLQAQEYIPEIYTAAVKKAECRNLATDYENSEEILTRTLQNALSDYKNIAPLKIEVPFTIELTFYRTDMCEETLQYCKDDVERVDARTLRKVAKVLERYEDLKL